ncbi:MAG: hypothetical protein ABR529_04385 [Actinomycetota bacterium]
MRRSASHTALRRDAEFEALGLAAEEVEQLITVPLEMAFGVAQLKDSGKTSPGASTTTAAPMMRSRN